MAPKILPEMISRDIVKPSISTSKNHPTIYNLSFFDQTSPCIYIPLLLFYKSNGETDRYRSNKLKTSLSATLTEFYPLAGRMKDDFTHECNDKGVVFLEATMECNLSDILECPNGEIIKLLCPDGLDYKDCNLSSPLVVQVTFFECGGMSIGLCTSHKILDMESTSNFLQKWASFAANSEREFSPEFNTSSIYPPLDLPFLKGQKPPQDMNNCAFKRVVFNAENISKLKEIAANYVPNPTRIEVVVSLLHKAAAFANSKVSSSGCNLKSTIMNHVMNIRTKVSPPMSKSNTGNLTGIFPVLTRGDREVEFGLLVKEFRKEKTRYSNSCAEMLSNEELYSFIFENAKEMGNLYTEDNEQVYFCSSWSRYPLYEIDFGWGKPIWAATLFWALKNLILMIDTKGGDGIETFVTLDEKAMAVFEQDEELLSFCSINPSVV